MSEEPTVLVIDDLPQNTRLLEAILTPKGYQVRVRCVGGRGPTYCSGRTNRTSCCWTS